MAINELSWAQEELPFPCVLLQVSLENSQISTPEQGQIFLVLAGLPFDGTGIHIELATGYAGIGQNINWTGELVIDQRMRLVGQMSHGTIGTSHRLQALLRMLPPGGR